MTYYMEFYTGNVMVSTIQIVSFYWFHYCFEKKIIIPPQGHYVVQSLRPYVRLSGPLQVKVLVKLVFFQHPLYKKSFRHSVFSFNEIEMKRSFLIQYTSNLNQCDDRMQVSPSTLLQLWLDYI